MTPEAEMLARITRQVTDDLDFYETRKRAVPPAVSDMALLVAEVMRLRAKVAELTTNQNQK